ncbi:MAG: hypothetical protein HYV27_13030 [Candidatus Hydrogenedentes bacterium]|nr:hypothetical protein [Candidatus Hydrogenedentota bacterium]
MECAGQFGDFVWYDVNGNGIQDSGEPGIEGVELSLYDLNDTLLQTTVTDANGAYYLYYYTVCGETYKIVLNEATIPDGLVLTIVEAGGDPAVDSNLNPWTGILPLPAPGENFTEDLTIDFGLVDEPEICYGQIGDFVWYDLNGNGLQESGEPGIEGVELSLYDVNDVLLGTTLTNAGGNYLFTEGVFCGETYKVVLDESTLPVGLIPTVLQAGGDESIDSNPNPFTVVLSVPPVGETFTEDLTVDFGYVEAPEVCEPCEGGVTNLTLQYLGNTINAKIVVNTPNGVVFNGTVQPDETFSISGLGANGVLGAEISVILNCKPKTKIQTGCTQPIGPGLIVGDFLVVSGTSLLGGELCPLDPEGDDCKPCEGKVTELTLGYNGSTAANVVIKTKMGVTIFSGNVAPGDSIFVSPPSGETTLGTEIYIYLDGCLKAQFHTSCSQPIGPGSISGDFVVLDGKSRIGGLLCPPSDDDGDDEGGWGGWGGWGGGCSHGWNCKSKCNTHNKCGSSHKDCDKYSKCGKHGKSGDSHKNCDKDKYSQKCKKHGKSGDDHDNCDKGGNNGNSGCNNNKSNNGGYGGKTHGSYKGKC